MSAAVSPAQVAADRKSSRTAGTLGRRVVVAAIVAACAGPARALDSITAEGIVDAPVAAVWNAWTTGEGLASWLAPQADIELRVDGRMRVIADARGSLDGPAAIENRVLSFEPQRMLSIRVSRAPSDFPFRSRVGEMWTVLSFAATADGRTLLRIVGLGFAADEEAQRMRRFFQAGNAHTLLQLQKRFRP
jgi:uncharacterized protein YndB with AHSA1/START domain